MCSMQANHHRVMIDPITSQHNLMSSYHQPLGVGLSVGSHHVHQQQQQPPHQQQHHTHHSQLSQGEQQAHSLQHSCQVHHQEQHQAALNQSLDHLAESDVARHSHQTIQQKAHSDLVQGQSHVNHHQSSSCSVMDYYTCSVSHRSEYLFLILLSLFIFIIQSLSMSL